MLYGKRIGQSITAYLMRNIIGTIKGVVTKEPIVAITFDDGPHPVYSPRLLELLNKYSAKVTFFVVGETAQHYPELLNRIREEGHKIGNHSWDHTSFPTIKGKLRRRQIRACQEVLEPDIDKIFRPPYGHQNILSRIDALLLGYKVITWGLAVDDWCIDSPKELEQRLLTGIEPGKIVLLHDALYAAAVEQHERRDAMLCALERVLHKLRDQYTFVTVPELLKRGKPVRCNWYRQGDPTWMQSLKKNRTNYSIEVRK